MGIRSLNKQAAKLDTATGHNIYLRAMALVRQVWRTPDMPLLSSSRYPSPIPAFIREGRPRASMKVGARQC